MAFLSFFWVILLQLLFIFSYNNCNALNSTKVSAIFVFGDSAVDTGNNNYLPTLFKANFKPYGMNLPGRKPTGRFSDGKLVPDFLASLLGLENSVPPFLKPNMADKELIKGACFASAAAGLDNQTLPITGQINMLKQPKYFAAYINRLSKMFGKRKARRIVRESLTMITAGSVDWMYNYYLVRTNRSLHYTVPEYQDLLLNNLQVLIKKLYDLGSRKMSVSGLIPMGCQPVIMTVNSPRRRRCLKKANSNSRMYNKKLVKLLAQLQPKLPGSILQYADIYTPLMEIIKNPNKHGFVESGRSCCGNGLFEFGQSCNPYTPVCKNPHQYVFWDAVHPSESACRYITNYLSNHFGPLLST